jgi:hypothetical protein
MLQSKIGRHFLVSLLILNALLIGPFVYLVMTRPDLLSAFLPGKFSPALSLDLTGNMLFFSLLLLVNALLLLAFGIGGTWHALWAGLRVSPRKMRWLLHERAGLASDIAGVVAVAVQEEEKAEIHYLDRARGFLAAGLLLFAVAVPMLCIAYTAAAPTGAPIFESGGKVLANSAVSHDDVVKFSVDQLASLLLNVPEIFHLRATNIEINGANIALGVLVVLYRTMMGLGLLLLFVGMRRARALLFNALEVAMPVSEIVAMEPVLQDGHGHAEHVEETHRHVVHEEQHPVETPHHPVHEEHRPVHTEHRRVEEETVETHGPADLVPAHAHAPHHAPEAAVHETHVCAAPVHHDEAPAEEIAEEPVHQAAPAETEIADEAA